MIRLPPSLITLGRSDIKDFEKHKDLHRQFEAEAEAQLKATEDILLNREFALFTVGAHDGPSFVGAQSQYRVRNAETSTPEGSWGDVYNHSSTTRTLPYHGSGPRGRGLGQKSNEDTQVGDGYSTMVNTSGEEHGYITIGMERCLENPTLESQQPSSPSKDDFHYGGFFETSAQNTPTGLQKSSPFNPDDISTPQNIQIPEARRLRTRDKLPRSPLYLSQNLSSSPERLPTSGLTPRVISRVATHNTPGIIFAQPARRPPRRSPRTLRHQTNSFSFDSSGRSSAAYEQDRISSTSTADTRPSGDLSLHEELRGSSLEGSSIGSEASFNVPDHFIEDGSAFQSIGTTSNSKKIILSSPQLPLPPPFSTMPRTASRADSLPSVTTERILNNPQTSPVTHSSSTPIISRDERGYPSPSSPQPASGTTSGPLPSREFSPGFLQRAASFLSSYRSRTPSSRQSSRNKPSLSSSLQTPRQSRQSPRDLEPQTPSQSYQVYNDAISPETQPQTPANLPEARHQSRYHPSYTAPVARPHTTQDSTSMNSSVRIRFGSLVRRRQPLNSTPSRRGEAGGRSESPVGLLAGGFQGLYGGRENGDEEENWAEGVRFNNAEVRLWGLRDARNDGRSMRTTPEPEEWRVGRRN